jgi:tetratricopeptide (TPR) repeat protein
MALNGMRSLLLLLLCSTVVLCANGDLAAQTPQELLRNGLLALQRNDLEAAQADLQSAAAQQPSNPRVWVALSQTLWKRKEFAKADDAAQKAWSFAGEDSAVLRGLVIYYLERDQTVRAAEAQARFAAVNPADEGAQERAIALYFEAVQPLLAAQKFGEALAILQKASPSVVKSAQIQIALGVAYYGLRRYDESAEAFLAVIALDPSLKQPYLFLGKMLEQISLRLEEVTRLFVAFEKQNPFDPDGVLLHAKALDARAVEPEAARKLLEKVIAMVPGNADAHFELGTLLERTRHFPEAAAEFERAEALNPSDPSTHYRLSRLYQRLNKPEAAIAEREQHRKMVTAQNAAR